MARPDAVRVTIFNQSYSLLASGEAPGRVEELAQRVDDLMHMVASQGGNLDAARIAVLACLHLADQLQTAEDDLAKLRDNVSSKAREFSVLLDEAIDDPQTRSQTYRPVGDLQAAAEACPTDKAGQDAATGPKTAERLRQSSEEPGSQVVEESGE